MEQAKLNIIQHQEKYWKNMAEQSEIDTEIKKQTLIKKKKDIELQDRAMRHLDLKDEILRNRFLAGQSGDPLAISNIDNDKN